MSAESAAGSAAGSGASGSPLTTSSCTLPAGVSRPSWAALWQVGEEALTDSPECSAPATDYLEYKFGTIKCYNGRNNFIIPFIVRM